MKIFALIRQSHEEKDLEHQKSIITEYANQNGLKINSYLEYNVSAGKGKNKNGDVIFDALKSGDILVVTELTRMGRNLLQILNLINDLYSRSVGIIFIKQPELSTASNGNHSLAEIFRYFAEAEREFISIRTKQGLAAAQAKGKLLGRPKGSHNKKGRLLDPFKNNIKYYLEVNIPIQSILKLINRKITTPVSYNALKYFIENDRELKLLRKKAAEEEIVG